MEKMCPLLRSKLDKGIELQRRYPKAVFIVSGGQGKDELISEGVAMAKYLYSQNIPEKVIIIESKSTNTYKNLLYSKEKIVSKEKHPSYITIVSNNFHILRATVISKKVNLNASVIGSHPAYYFYANAIIREFITNLLFLKKHI
ncbi:YdcF family protein (plasmid) [Staphylococcus cohnii]|nr:YdcF family protein [Staphylococcus cohnii]